MPGESNFLADKGNSGKEMGWRRNTHSSRSACAHKIPAIMKSHGEY